jgi:hypothetical protein
MRLLKGNNRSHELGAFRPGTGTGARAQVTQINRSFVILWRQSLSLAGAHIYSIHGGRPCPPSASSVAYIRSKEQPESELRLFPMCKCACSQSAHLREASGE